MARDFYQDEATHDMLPPTALHQAREQSKAIWARDLQGLYEHTRERFADVRWIPASNFMNDEHHAEILTDNDGAMEADDMDAMLRQKAGDAIAPSTERDGIFAHKAIIYVRASRAFKDRFFPVAFGPSPSNGVSMLSQPTVADSASAAGGHRPSSRISVVKSQPNSHPSNTPSATSRRPGASLYASGHANAESEGRMLLSDQETPELLKQALEWLYTGHGVPLDYGAKASSSLADLAGPGGSFEQNLLNDGIGSEISVIRAKGVDDIDALQREQLSFQHIKLSQDLTYMWRSRLYTDVKIRIGALANAAASAQAHDPSAFKSKSAVIMKVTSVSSMRSVSPGQTLSVAGDREFDLEGVQDEDGRLFSAHRFILCSRSPYLHQVLLNSGAFQNHPAAKQHGSTTAQVDIPEIVLPSPPFTPLAMYFILGYLYSGTLAFAHRTLDLITAFSVMKCAMFLEIDPLVAEVEAIIREDICHGMRYPKVILGKEMGGCSCKKCAKRIPKVLRFAVAPDVQAVRLKADAMQYLLRGGWSDCWNKDFANLDESIQDDVVAGICDQLTPNKLVTAYRKISTAQNQVNAEKADSADILQDLLDTVRASVRQKLVENFQQVVREPDFLGLIKDEIMDRSMRDLIMQDLGETVRKAEFCRHAPTIYEIIQSELLDARNAEMIPVLRPGLSGREVVEDAKTEVLAVIRRRIMQLREVGAFDGLREPTLRELSEALPALHTDLVRPRTPPPRSQSPAGAPRRMANAATATRASATSANTGVSQSVDIRSTASRAGFRRSPSATLRERTAQTLGTALRTRNTAESNLTTREYMSSLQRSAGMGPPTSTSIGGRNALTVTSSTVRPLSSHTTSATRPATRTPNLAGRAGPAAAATRAAGNAIKSNASPSRLGTTTSASIPLRASAAPAAGTSSIATSGRKPNLAATKAVSPGLPPTTRIGSTTSLCRLAGQPDQNTAAPVSRILPGGATPLAGRNPIGASATGLRNSASSASLRNASAKATADPASRGSISAKKVLGTAPERRPVGQSSTSANAPKGKIPLPSTPARTSVASRIAGIEKQSGANSSAMARSTLNTVLKGKSNVPDRQTASTSRIESNASPPTAESIAEEASDNQYGQRGDEVKAQDSTLSPSAAQDSKSANVALDPTPPRALRPLKLVEKRHSLSPKPSQSGDTTAFLTRTDSQSDIIGSEQEQDTEVAESTSSRSAAADTLPASSDQTVTQKEGRYGLGLGIVLPAQTTLGSNLTVATPPVTTASQSMKYHPASAFDPPPRIPSISVTDSGMAEEDDECTPYDKSQGASLAVGIPCVIYITPSSREPDTIAGPASSLRTRLKAVCRYIGQVSGRSGEWIGVEISLASLGRLRTDISQDPDEPLSTSGLHDGSWEGIRYYKIHQTTTASPASSQGAFSRPLSPFGSPHDASRDVSGRFRSMSSLGRPSAHTALDTRSLCSGLRGSSMTSWRRPSSTNDGAWAGTMSFMSNPETGWVPGGQDPASNRKCGLWIRPSDVVLVPGAHD